MSATGNTAKMSEAKDVTIINPSPSGEVEKAIEDHWINCMALAIRACNPAVNGDEIRAGLDKADAELRAFITTYAEDNERLRATVETLQFGERMHNERAEAAQAEIERLRAERDSWKAAHAAEVECSRMWNAARMKVVDELKASQAQAEEMRKALEEADAACDGHALDVGFVHGEPTRKDLQLRLDTVRSIARTALMKGGE